MRRLVLAGLVMAFIIAQGAAAQKVTDPKLLQDLNNGDQPTANPFERYRPVEPQPEKLGPGPYTLVVFGVTGEAATRFDYRTGRECQKARDEVLRQLETPTAPGVTIIVPPPKRAVCVPR